MFHYIVQLSHYVDKGWVFMNQVIEQNWNKNIDKNSINNNNSKKSKSPKNKKILKRFLITLLALFIIGISTVGVLLYGPYNGFRDWLITTSMTTMTHQWIAHLFYDDDTINAVWLIILLMKLMKILIRMQ